MPKFPLRDLGSVGLVSDRHPVDVSLVAFTDAINVRFDGRGVSRSSIFKYIDPDYTYSKTPTGLVFGSSSVEGFLITAFSDGSLEQWNNGTVTDVSATETPNSGNNQITYTELGGLIYINRGHSQPLYRTDPFSGAFQTLPGWDASHTCVSLRRFKDYLIAINVTQGAYEYPGMVKWSNTALPGSPPADWYIDGTDGSNGGENVLNDISGGLVDGHPMASSFILYGDFQSWRMEHIGGNDIFGFYKLFDDAGIMAPNCVVDVNNIHYVFGRNDIYIHDGITKSSIADDRIKSLIFDDMDYDNRDRCFVLHDELKHEIHFCYPTKSSNAPWSSDDITGCNRSAVYNYIHNTWSMCDMPSAVAATELTLHFSPTWDDFTPEEWENAYQKWSGWVSASPRSSVILCSGNPALSAPAAPYFLDDAIGLQSSEPVMDIWWEGTAQMRKKDLDDLGFSLSDRKWVRRIIPQSSAYDDTSHFNISAGSSASLNGPVLWDKGKDFYPISDTKYDCRINGKYISLRFSFPPGEYCEIGGFDLDIEKVAGR